MVFLNGVRRHNNQIFPQPGTISRIEFQMAEPELDTMEECTMCFEDVPLDRMMSCDLKEGEPHPFCNSCVKGWVLAEIEKGKTSFRCLNAVCDAKYALDLLKPLIPQQRYSELRKLRASEALQAANIPDMKQCPFCQAWTVVENDRETILVCWLCHKESCRMCSKENHAPYLCSEMEDDEATKLRKEIADKMTEALIRTCPKCGMRFAKDGGCNKMVCEKCGTFMCFVCRKQITGYDHFGVIDEGFCPLTSDDVALEEEAVKQAAMEAKRKMKEERPGIVLAFDPTVGVLGEEEAERRAREKKEAMMNQRRDGRRPYHQRGRELAKNTQGFSEELVDVPHWLHRRIIGKGGSNIKDLVRGHDKVKVDFEASKAIVWGPSVGVRAVAEKLKRKVDELRSVFRLTELQVDWTGKEGILERIRHRAHRRHVEITAPVGEGVMKVEGKQEDVDALVAEILEAISNDEEEVEVTVDIPKRLWGKCIGKKGETVRAIEEGFKVEIKFLEDQESIWVKGANTKVQGAVHALKASAKEIEEKNFRCNVVLHSGYEGFMKKHGETVIALVKSHNVSVTRPISGRSGEDGDSVAVTGKKGDVKKFVQEIEKLQDELKTASATGNTSEKADLKPPVSRKPNQKESRGPRLRPPKVNTGGVKNDKSSSSSEGKTTKSSNEPLKGVHVEDTIPEATAEEALPLSEENRRLLLANNGAVLQQCSGENVTLRFGKGELIVKGSAQTVASVVQRLHEVFHNGFMSEEDVEEMSVLTCHIPPHLHSCLKGFNDCNVKMLSETHNVEVCFGLGARDEVQIVGMMQNCTRAKEQLMSLIPEGSEYGVSPGPTFYPPPFGPPPPQPPFLGHPPPPYGFPPPRGYPPPRPPRRYPPPQHIRHRHHPPPQQAFKPTGKANKGPACFICEQVENPKCKQKFNVQCCNRAFHDDCLINHIIAQYGDRQCPSCQKDFEGIPPQVEKLLGG